MYLSVIGLVKVPVLSWFVLTAQRKKMFDDALAYQHVVSGGDATACNKEFYRDIGPNPGVAFGAEGHCAWSIGEGGLKLADIPRYPPQNEYLREILEMAMPERHRCACLLEEWSTYAACRTILEAKPIAISGGVNGYDSYSEHVSSTFNISARLYDCYNTDPPKGFLYEFFPVCVGNSSMTRNATSDGNSRKFETLNEILKGYPDKSVALKLDIEGDEIRALQMLAESDFSKIQSLSIEFHMWFGDLLGNPQDGTCDFEGVFRAMKILQRHFIVVKSFYALTPLRHTVLPDAVDCNTDGFIFPTSINVNYVSAAASECTSETEVTMRA